MPVTTEENALDALSAINMVTNNTPWETDALVSFLAPYLVDLPFTSIVIESHRPMPGWTREKQRIVKLVTKGRDDNDLVIGILSPKRAAVRTDLLDRLSMADDLKPHETKLPRKALETLHHALMVRADKQRTHTKWSCERGECRCSPARLDHVPLIRGDTRAKTSTPKPLATLKRDLRSAQRSVGYCQARLDKATKRRDILLKRINKAETK